MSNPFTSLKDYVEKPKRNTFDLSFQNNLTMEFGKLYPVFCKEVVPGDSFRIQPTFGLRFMPLVFPVQTRMQANLHFFYVRNRNLWKDWPDFIGRTKQDLVTPFLSPRVAKKLCKSRGLGDYFGLPTTLVGDYGRVFFSNQKNSLYNHDTQFGYYTNYWMLGIDQGQSLGAIKRYTASWIDVGQYDPDLANPFAGAISSNITQPLKADQYGNHFVEMECNFNKYALQSSPSGTYGGNLVIFWKAPDGINSDGAGDYRAVAELNSMSLFSSVQTSNTEDTSTWTENELKRPVVAYAPDGVNYTKLRINLTMGMTNARHFVPINPNNAFIPSSGNTTFQQVIDACKEHYGTLDYKIGIYGTHFDGHTSNDELDRVLFSAPNQATTSSSFYGVKTFQVELETAEHQDVADQADHLNPYATGDIKVSALPFRAYESIYNAFYRNQFNDPFILNGVKEFNKFITNNEGGEDDTDYDLMKRNWEMDFLTSAKQSPVDGDITPLVGVSSTGAFTFQNSDGTTYTVTPIVGDDGHTLTGIDSIQGEPENNTGIRRLMDLASVGISINDFRNVNALQRWLETNLRRGYRYKDQLMSHFGVEAKFDVLDMPEFIGGMSEPVMVNQISQSVDQTGNPDGLGDFPKVLGSYAGQASILAQSKHDVSKYCDEHGFIIGILSVTPVPNYSQLLPKMFLKNNVLDYYFPEFGHIGNQPISYSEVCPLQSFAAEAAGGDEKLTDVFGYQRAWYDYLASVDEVHGDFRLSLDGFLINREFDERPELGKKFIECDVDTISNPFSVVDDGDKILGEVYFQVTAQRPIPKYGIPRLE